MNTALFTATGMLTAILLGGCAFNGPLQAPETGYQTTPTEPAAALKLQASGASRNFVGGAALRQVGKAAGQRLTETEQ